MKRILSFLRRLLFYLFGLALFIVAIVSFQTRYRMYKYYSDPQSYCVVTAYINNIYYDNNYAVFHFSFDSTYSEFGSDQDFKVSGKNYKVMMQNGFEDQIKIGDQVTFVVATNVFFDGYALPIIAISSNSTNYLDQDVGRDNLLSSIWFKTPLWRTQSANK